MKHSIVIAHHETSISLEDQFWSDLKEIAGSRHQTVSDLVSDKRGTRRQSVFGYSSVRSCLLSWASGNRRG